MCKHHFTFDSYWNIAQLLNINKVDLLALDNNRDLIGYFIAIALTSCNLTPKTLYIYGIGPKSTLDSNKFKIGYLIATL